MLKQLICWFKKLQENNYKKRLLTYLCAERDGYWNWIKANKMHEYADYYRAKHAQLSDIISKIEGGKFD